VVNLADVPVFAAVYLNATNDYSADFKWDGAVNLSDVIYLSGGLGSECPPVAKAAAVAAESGEAAGEVRLVFDAEGATASRMLEVGRPIDAWLVISGQAARDGVRAFSTRLRTSSNVVVNSHEVVGKGLDVGRGDEFVVGYAETRQAESGRPLQLVHLRVSVTDDSPAYFWLEADRLSGLELPAVVVGDEILAIRPVSGDATAPVASLNDKDFTPGGETPLVRNLAMSIAPNPFNPMTKIRFSLPAAGAVELRVFDASGRLVTTLASEVMGAGEHTVVWNGTDSSGRGVASGVYFSSLRTDAGSLLQKMLLMK